MCPASQNRASSSHQPPTKPWPPQTRKVHLVRADPMGRPAVRPRELPGSPSHPPDSRGALFVSRPAQAPEDDPTQEPNVRTHRMTYPTRRPLLISAILVALTSIPTIIVVAAGTATLHGQQPSRPPGIADPGGGRVV